MATTITQTAGEIAVVDDLSAPTILVDTFSGIISTGGVIVFGCTRTVLTVQSDTEMTPKRHVILRLALPVGSFPGLVTLLNDQMAQMVMEGAAGEAHQWTQAQRTTWMARWKL